MEEKKKKKKKKKLSRREKMGRAARMKDALTWIHEYSGRALVQKYKKRYGLKTIIAAIDELLKLGVSIDKEYIEKVKGTLEKNLAYRDRKREERIKRENSQNPQNFQDSEDLDNSEDLEDSEELEDEF